MECLPFSLNNNYKYYEFKRNDDYWSIFSIYQYSNIYTPNIKIMITVTLLSKILYFLILRIIAILLNTPTYENGYTSKATALLNVIPIFSIYIYLHSQQYCYVSYI